MKKTILKVLTLSLVAVMLLCTLASCGKMISGSYDSQIEFLGQKWTVTYTFKANKVEAVSKATILGNVKSETVEGTYKITENSDGSMEITFDFEKETDIFKNETVTFEQGEDYIKLGLTTYNKVQK